MNITLDLQILTDSAVITRACHNFVSEVEMATLLDVPANLTPLSPSPHIWVHPCFLRTEVPGPSSVLFLQMWESIILKVALVPFSRKWHETPTSEPREGTVDGVTSEQNKLPFLKGYRFMLIFSIYLSIYGAHPRACSFLLLIRLPGLCPLPWTHCYRASHQKGLNYCDMPKPVQGFTFLSLFDPWVKHSGLNFKVWSLDNLPSSPLKFPLKENEIPSSSGHRVLRKTSEAMVKKGKLQTQHPWTLPSHEPWYHCLSVISCGLVCIPGSFNCWINTNTLPVHHHKKKSTVRKYHKVMVMNLS